MSLKKKYTPPPLYGDTIAISRYYSLIFDPSCSSALQRFSSYLITFKSINIFQKYNFITLMPIWGLN